MQDWLTEAKKLSTSIQTNSTTVEIHKSRSKTLAYRVKSVFDSITALDPVSINMNDIASKGYYSMLMATIEEISDYHTILQKKDKALGKRVMRYGSDEESFSNWNETLLTCSADLKLSVDNGLFDADRDLVDFNEDMEDLQRNLLSILKNVPGVLGSVETAVEENQKLLKQQQADRTQYKTQQAVKLEKTFNAKLIRYDTIIGIGGFGEVWKAKYKGDDVAIKKVPSKALGLQAIASLKLEAEFMKKLSHPRIVACFGILESNGHFCMVMELCVNGNLAEYMLSNIASNVVLEKRNEFALDIATGMNYLHKLGVIHRDLKPGNVVLDKHFRVKITDFGLSVIKTATQTSMKLDECGTPQYMAPESFGLVPIFSTKTDVYAFSIVLWELLHWRVAYGGVGIGEIKDAIKDGDRLPIDNSVPLETRRLISECWDDNPKKRPTFASIIERFNSPVTIAILILLLVAGSAGVYVFITSSSKAPEQIQPLNPISKSSSSVLTTISTILDATTTLTTISLAVKDLNTNISALSVSTSLTNLKPFGPSTIRSNSATSTMTNLTATASVATSPLPTTTKSTITRTASPVATVSTFIQDSIRLNGVWGMTIDEYDNLYVVTIPVDYPYTQPGYPLVYKIVPNSPPTISLIADLSNDGQGFLDEAQGICYFNNALYVPRVGQLTKIDMANNNMVTRFAGSGLSGGGQNELNGSAVFNGAKHCTVDSRGNIYVGEQSSTIRNVSQVGYVSTVINVPSGNFRSMMLIGISKLIFPSTGPLTAGDDLLRSIDLNNLQITTLTGNSTQPPPRVGPSLLLSLYRLSGVTMDELGNLYFTDEFTVYKMDVTNYVSVFAGSGFSGSRFLVFDSKGRIFVTDQGNSAIKVINW